MKPIGVVPDSPLASMAARVRTWKATKRVSMSRKQVQRCAKDLGGVICCGA